MELRYTLKAKKNKMNKVKTLQRFLKAYGGVQRDLVSFLAYKATKAIENKLGRGDPKTELLFGKWMQGHCLYFEPKLKRATQKGHQSSSKFCFLKEFPTVKFFNLCI